MQLNLFQWDIIAVGKGYQGLADLDLDAARDHFSRVLAARPDHPSAGQGLRDVQVWEEAFRELEGMAQEAALGFLWGRIAGFPFGDSEYRRNLRAALIRRLLAMMGDRADFYLPPDLCPGFLHLQLADYAAAERELRHLLARPGWGESTAQAFQRSSVQTFKRWNTQTLERCNAGTPLALPSSPES